VLNGNIATQIIDESDALAQGLMLPLSFREWVLIVVSIDRSRESVQVRNKNVSGGFYDFKHKLNIM